MIDVHLIILAIIQAITEFLPVSSSAHLIIPSQVWHWEDQGLAFDVAVHTGTLLAVVIYYIADLVKIGTYTIESAMTFKQTPVSRVGWFLVIATIPVCVVGVLAEPYISTIGRSIAVIGYATIFFGLLLGLASMVNRRMIWRNIVHTQGARPDSLRNLTLAQALLVGCAQALALIPGTSRSGVTLTAGMFLGLRPEAAARFSFLLSIPVILASAVFEAYKLYQSDMPMQQTWVEVLLSIIISFVLAILVIHLFLKYVSKSGMAFFVIYRLILGGILLYLYYSGSV